jgi:hypothetical protein
MNQLNILKSSLEYAYTARNEHLFYCPFCEHHKPKLSINIDKGYHCWVCDKSGKNIYYLLRRFATFDNQQEWLRNTNEEIITDLEELIIGTEKKEFVKQKIDLPSEYRGLWNASGCIYSRKSLNYLNNARNIGQSKILEWKIGFCYTGEYEERIIIPSFDADGDVNYFVSRTYVDHWKKYKNPPVSKNIIFNELLIDWDEPVTIVEGVFDAVHESNMIPILGSTLHENTLLFQKLAEKQPQVFMALDPDAHKKEKTIISNLLKYGLDVWKVPVPSDKDVGSMTQQEYKTAKQSATQTGFEYELFNMNI